MRAALFLLLFCTASAAAQPAFDFGFRVGGNLTSLKTEFIEFDSPLGPQESDLAPGFEIAGFADASLSSLLTVTAEIGYARRRYSESIPFQAESSPTISDEEITFTSSHNLGTLGIFGRAVLPGTSTFAPYLLAGPRLDLQIDSDLDIEYPDDYVVPRAPGQQPDFSDQFADTVLSGVVGVGVEMHRAVGPDLRLEARYDRTLTNFVSGDLVDGTLTGFGLSVGVTF